MINDILDYSQISNGKLRLNHEPFCVWETIKDVAKLIKFQANEKGLEFKLENQASSHNGRNKAIVISDPNRLKQILLNLLGNALKFTNQGIIRISLESEIDRYIIKVTDTGMGIKEEDQRKLFKLFGKLQNAKSIEVNKSGVGLGLAISQSLVKILNKNAERAEIKVISEVGKGSRFYFPLLLPGQDEIEMYPNLDINECYDEEMIDNISLMHRYTGKKSYRSVARKESLKNSIINILVVDDDQINILVAKNFLKCFDDFRFDVANNGADALEIVTKKAEESKYYDIILMDCNMPKMDGFETTRILRQMILNNKIPNLSIIACTANASPIDYEFCFKSGMCDYISKPFSKGELRAKIKKNYQKKKGIEFL
jgi:CheY-like chemotaxis protein